MKNGGGDDVNDEKKVGSFMKSTTTATAAVATRIGWEGTSLNNLLCQRLSMTISMLHLYPPPTRNRVVIGMNNEGGVVKMDT